MHRRYIRYCLLFLLVLTFSLSVVQWATEVDPSYPNRPLREGFNPALGHLTSMERLNTFLDSVAATRQIATYSRAYVDLADSVLRGRFFHSYSHYSLADNYLSYLTGKLIWSDLSAIVEPDDILKFNSAACSQQSIVLMALLRQKGFRTRKVGLVGHFCIGVFYDNDWHLYDTNLEPSFQKDRPIPSAPALANNPTLRYAAYGRILNQASIDQMFSRVTLEENNRLPGWRVRLLHRITGFLSHTLWLFFGALYIFIFFKSPVRIYQHVRHQRVPVVQ